MFLDRINRACTHSGHRVWLLIILVVVVFILLIVHNATSRLQSYQDSQTGISFGVPGNWRVRKSERVLSYAVTPKWKPFLHGSVYIAILPGAVSNYPVFRTLEEGLEIEINRLNLFFKLDKVDVIHSIQILESGTQKMATVTIAVPTTSIPDNAAVTMNQMGQRNPSVFQIIDIYIFDKDADHYASIIVYKGKNDYLNTQADEIVRSIRFAEVEQP